METYVVDVDFYVKDTVPEGMKEYASEHGIELPDGLIAVKTRVPFVSYEFQGLPTPDSIMDYMRQLSREDGRELEDVLREAFPLDED